MDPYLERHWLDVHNRLVMLSSVVLNERLPADLVASTDERVKVEGPDEEYGLYRPDVTVVEEGGAGKPPVTGTAAVGTMPPGTVRLVAAVEPTVERYIRVVDTSTDRAVTVIEFLSPSNKMGEGLVDYRRKREALLDSGVNLVEVDLSRRGDWQRLLRPYSCPVSKRSEYRATTWLAGDRGGVLLSPFGLREALPELPIPLRAKDGVVTLPLQEVVEQVYQTGRYGTRLNYGAELEPAVEGEDAVWVREVAGRGG
jgi:hypothetical protein